MTDDFQQPERSLPPELGPVVARLQEIHRKCLSLGSRNDEARDTAVRIERVIAALTGRSDGDGRPPNLTDLAAELFPVARLFESLGFLSVARELAHVEKILTGLDPGRPRHTPVAPGPVASDGAVRPSTPKKPAVGEPEPDSGDQPSPSRHIPVPVLLGVTVALIAVLASFLLVRQQLARYASGAAGPTPSAKGSPNVSASPMAHVQTPVDGSASPGATPTPGRRARLASLVGEARLAQRDGNIDQAISLLSQAALIESKANLVIQTARSLVDDLLARADGAADAARWEEAAQHVERARELAIRFELPTDSIDAAVRRHARLERFESVAPTDTARLRQLTGNRAIIVTADEGRHEGWIHDVTGGILELHQGIEVGRGGTLFHVDRIPLAEVVEIRVYPD